MTYLLAQPGGKIDEYTVMGNISTDQIPVEHISIFSIYHSDTPPRSLAPISADRKELNRTSIAVEYGEL
jgi:hypothetical protein